MRSARSLSFTRSRRIASGGRSVAHRAGAAGPLSWYSLRCLVSWCQGEEPAELQARRGVGGRRRRETRRALLLGALDVVQDVRAPDPGLALLSMHEAPFWQPTEGEQIRGHRQARLAAQHVHAGVPPLVSLPLPFPARRRWPLVE